MKKLLSIFLFALFLFSNAQNQKFTYRLVIKNDSLTKINPSDELMALVVDAKGSVFYSEDKVISDSVTNDLIKKAQTTGNYNIDMKGRRIGRFGSIVKKSYPDYTINFTNRVGSENYSYDDKRKPVWKITTEVQKIGKWDCQKATTNYLGRDWEAWFTTEIPIQDGPYKFHGLPGLIVKISDVEEDFTFMMEGVNNNFKIANLKQDAVIKVNYERFKKAFQEDYLDPGKYLRQLTAGSGGNVVTVSFKVNGKDMDMKEMERKNAELAKKRKLTDLNPLEKDLISN